MKKGLVVISAVLVAIVIFGSGFVFAQYGRASAESLYQGNGYGMMGGGRGGMMAGRGGYGPIHDYVEQALATKLGMTESEIETQLASGKTMYQIAIDKGIKEADVPTLLSEVHKTAFDKAVADGVLTQAQADLMLKNMQANGFNSANCTVNGSGVRGTNRGKFGGMMGRWNQAPSVTPAP